MDTEAKFGSETKHGVIANLFRDFLVAFPLVAYVYKSMVYTHLEFSGRLVATALVLVELLQTLQGYMVLR